MPPAGLLVAISSTLRLKSVQLSPRTGYVCVRVCVSNYTCLSQIGTSEYVFVSITSRYFDLMI